MKIVVSFVAAATSFDFFFVFFLINSFFGSQTTTTTTTTIKKETEANHAVDLPAALDRRVATVCGYAFTVVGASLQHGVVQILRFPVWRWRRRRRARVTVVWERCALPGGEFCQHWKIWKKKFFFPLRYSRVVVVVVVQVLYFKEWLMQCFSVTKCI